MMNIKKTLGVIAAIHALNSVAGGYCIEDDGDLIRIRKAGEKSAFAELWRSERSANCDMAIRTEKNSPFVFLDVTPKAGRVSKARLPRIGLKGISSPNWAGVGSGGLVTNLARKVGSYGFCALGEVKTRKGYVAAWLTDEWASGVVHFDGKGIEATAEYGPMTVPEGATPRTDTFVLGAFDDCRLGLEAYADAVAAHYGITLMPQISGFCTWYSDNGGYTTDRTKFARGACSEQLSREFADAAAKLAPWGFDYYQIDDKWQAGKVRMGPAMVFERVDPKGPYPNGMRPTVDYLNGKGFVAGLWYMPFSCDTKDPWWQDKLDLCVKSAVTSPADDGFGRLRLAQKEGEPFVTPFGAGALDMSNPAALDYVRRMASLVTKEWGFRMIKFDGMYSGAAASLGYGGEYAEEPLDCVVFADPGMSNAQAFRRGVKAMREGCAEGTRLLACNAKQNARGIVASYGLVDILRIGGDNGPLDDFPERYMAGPIDGSPRYFLNGRVWYNDPDPVYVRDAVPLGRARLMATWTSLGGMLYNFSDWLPWLSEGRVEILKRTLAPHRHPRCVRPVDYLANSIHNVWKLQVGEFAIYGFYNWDTNKVLNIDYEAAYADLDAKATYVGFDFWNDRFVGCFSKRLQVEVPPDDCRVLAVRAFDGTKPVLVSTSRHVASPVIDVIGEIWDARAKTLSGVSERVPGETYELRVYVPDGLTCVSAGTGSVMQQGNELRIRFTSDDVTSRWVLTFK